MEDLRILDFQIKLQSTFFPADISLCDRVRKWRSFDSFYVITYNCYQECNVFRVLAKFTGYDHEETKVTINAKISIQNFI